MSMHGMAVKRHPAEAGCLLKRENTILRIFGELCPAGGPPATAGLFLSLHSASDLFDQGLAVASKPLEVDLKVKHRIIFIRVEPESIWDHLDFSFLWISFSSHSVSPYCKVGGWKR
jgi:hypothetical protein